MSALGQQRTSSNAKSALSPKAKVAPLKRPRLELASLRLAKLLHPTPNSLPPECSVLRTYCLALQLAAFFDLFFEKFFFVEWHGFPSMKRGRLIPQ
jgi:hypothetical protein